MKALLGRVEVLQWWAPLIGSCMSITPCSDFVASLLDWRGEPGFVKRQHELPSKAAGAYWVALLWSVEDVEGGPRGKGEVG